MYLLFYATPEESGTWAVCSVQFTSIDALTPIPGTTEHVVGGFSSEAAADSEAQRRQVRSYARPSSFRT